MESMEFVPANPESFVEDLNKKYYALKETSADSAIDYIDKQMNVVRLHLENGVIEPSLQKFDEAGLKEIESGIQSLMEKEGLVMRM